MLKTLLYYNFTFVGLRYYFELERSDPQPISCLCVLVRDSIVQPMSILKPKRAQPMETQYPPKGNQTQWRQRGAHLRDRQKHGTFSITLDSESQEAEAAKVCH